MQKLRLKQLERDKNRKAKTKKADGRGKKEGGVVAQTYREERPKLISKPPLLLCQCKTALSLSLPQCVCVSQGGRQEVETALGPSSSTVNVKKTSLITKESQQFLSHSQGLGLPREQPNGFE